MSPRLTKLLAGAPEPVLMGRLLVVGPARPRIVTERGACAAAAT